MMRLRVFIVALRSFVIPFEGGHVALGGVRGIFSQCCRLSFPTVSLQISSRRRKRVREWRTLAWYEMAFLFKWGGSRVNCEYP